jgi:PAS domain S-box-containing protein
MLASWQPSVALAAILDALESAGIGCTIVLDGPGGLERAYANEAIARIFGVDVATMRALPAMSALVPPEHARLSALRESLGAQGQGPAFIETKIVRADGCSVPVEVGMSYAHLEGKRAAFVFMHDITAKATMESALRESEERFRRLAEACPDAIAVTVNGRYTYANPRALRQIGVSAEELGSVDPVKLVPPEQLAVVREQVMRIRAGETAQPVSVRVVAADGTESVLESSVIISSLHGEPALVSYTRDITERMRLQAELMKQDRLASVGMLAAGVAHELNNPLGSLGMQLNRLRENAQALGLSDDIQTALDQMNDAASRMQAIISDLLFMTRPVDQPQSHVDVNQIITSSIALLQAGMPQCPRIDVALDPIPPITGYASKLGQVFLNVLRNAVQAVDGVAQPHVRVRSYVAGDAVEVSISDNGPGVPREILPHLAQPFFTTKPHGTGLVLWISQTLVAQHGGKLNLASVAAEGMTVTVSLPH